MALHVSHQVVRSPDALAALAAQLHAPAGGLQDGQGRLHAHRSEQRPVLLINGRHSAAPAARWYHLLPSVSQIPGQRCVPW